MNEFGMDGTGSQRNFSRQTRVFQPSSIGLNTGTGAADQGLPIILMGSFAQLGATSSVPRHRVDSNDQVIDDFSWKIESTM